MRRALVTRGSGSIGVAICEGLAQQGNHAIIHCNSNIDGVTRVADSINNFNGSAEIVQFDIRDAAQTTLAIEALLKSGPIRILVNNPGCHYDVPMAGMMEDEWVSIIDTIINGFFYITKPILLPMMQTRWGRIVSISSVAGVTSMSSIS
ncbi:MAG: SDR family NAD(P)-dependent oxidoreductase [Candidatus Thiodiazotropha sp. (ex Lucinoma aequizonata)]|nr:SDR family NAD(P)-dependent oxidoreductase [Candidatus Thiodiazotropha sp. (ex Lucinoma aequizonata)]MCU7889747.1 SDR family NAD(P)-dependent oxidoreductase [Candidatus Thiodiazotropha sp. (ex Lucinoma aequizonata)]MCU7895135.1 SDR family NAD(P)-dependent oxidoreductase [Candidatus Thiodiazotropha sp. (ex Lucinoma aequizonata)]MCU7900321.1 SDR family NAD(P)-dependent oxidoreductase [Candidatus Thiodiazotropha sp. (ex Lucinoma aequizonata)]MCU7902069.1 SDR family NAD(P)-dependent oxidoreducta